MSKPLAAALRIGATNKSPPMSSLYYGPPPDSPSPDNSQCRLSPVESNDTGIGASKRRGRTDEELQVAPLHLLIESGRLGRVMAAQLRLPNDINQSFHFPTDQVENITMGKKKETLALLIDWVDVDRETRNAAMGGKISRVYLHMAK